MSIEDEIIKIETEITILEKKIADLRLTNAIHKGVIKHLKAIQGSNHSPVNRISRRKLYKGSIPSHLKSILKREANSPMKIAELVEALEKRGVTTNAKLGLSASVSSTLFKRSDIFRRVGHGTYCLVSKQKETVETE